MDGMLSQEEINALLNGIDSDDSSSEAVSSDDEQQSVELEEVLTSMEIDIMGELSNISMGTAATTLSSLVNQKVDITTPKVGVSTWQDLVDQYDRPCVFIQISYKEGINGNNVFILKDTDVKIIADLMMGGDSFIYREHQSQLRRAAPGAQVRDLAAKGLHIRRPRF